MAYRFLLQKHLRSLSRSLFPSSAASSSSAYSPFTELAHKPKPILQTPPSQPSSDTILNLTDHHELFSTIPTSKLLHASLILHASSIEPVVDFGTWVMNSRAVLGKNNLSRDLVLWFVRHSFFKHFCAGEDVSEMKDCLERMNESTGLKGMLDFAVEFTDHNHGCHENLHGFLQAAAAAKSLSPSAVSTVVVKVTALCPLRLLERISDLLRWQKKDPSFNLPWKQTSLPIFSDSSPLYHTLKKPEPLSAEEEHDLQLAHQRLSTICQACVDANVQLTIDAEHTKVQPAIDYFTYSSAIQYNRDGQPIVYGTMQAYLKDAKERLLLTTKTAEKMGVPMGFKLVRGAYMSWEKKLASSLGYDSPVHNSIQETHACYNDCASFMLDRIKSGSDGVILATHNVESGRLAATKAWELGIGKNRKLEFAQLYGMADALSFGLRNKGFQVSKYIPYGPVEVVIPYLLRRAEENRGLLSTSTLDRELMRKELQRRLMSTFGG